MGRKRLGDGAVGLVAVDLAVIAEEHAVGCVDKGVAEIFGHQAGGEILAAGDQLIHARIAPQARGELFHLTLGVEGEAELRTDIGKALFDGLQNVFAGDAVTQMRVAEV